MGARGAARMVAVGAVLAVLGVAVMVVFFAQPWRTCPDDDAPAGCPALPQDAAVVTVAGVVTLLALFLLVVGVAVRSEAGPGTPVGRSRRWMITLGGAAGCALGLFALAYLGGYWPW